MATYTESVHAGEFLHSEANGTLSRETITVASGQNLKAGAVLGVVTASGKYAALNPAATDGTAVAAGILFADTDATTADAAAVAIVRMAEVVAVRLVWPSGITSGEKTTALGQLADVFVVTR